MPWNMCVIKQWFHVPVKKQLNMAIFHPDLKILCSFCTILYKCVLVFKEELVYQLKFLYFIYILVVVYLIPF